MMGHVLDFWVVCYRDVEGSSSRIERGKWRVYIEERSKGSKPQKNRLLTKFTKGGWTRPVARVYQDKWKAN